MGAKIANLVELLYRQAQDTPEAIALIDAQNRRYTFADILAATQRCAGYLKYQSQVKPGDGVLLLQPLSPQLYVALAAIWQLGAVAVILNPLLGQSHIDRCAQRVPFKAWISPGWLFATQWRSRTLRQIPHKIAIGSSWLGTVAWQQVQTNAPDTTIAPISATQTFSEAIALLSLTSGTTGQPKVITRSHHLLSAQHQALQAVLRWQPGHPELTTLPLFGLANLVAGGTTVIPPVNVRRPSRVSGSKLRKTIAHHKIERMVAAPGIIRQLLKARRHLTLPSLQNIFIGGAPLTWKDRDRLQTLAPNAQITLVYGATEAEPIAVQRPEEIRESDRDRTRKGEGLLIGKPVLAIQLELIPLEHSSRKEPTTRSPIQSNNLGEIIVRGSHVLHLPNSPQNVIHGYQQWHRTGDVGHWDEQGRLWLLGRTSAILQDDRGILYPLSVECVANELPGVARSALVQWRGLRLLLVEWERTPYFSSSPERSPRRGKWVKPSQKDIAQLQAQLTWAQLDHIISVHHIPTDARHNAKVNSPKLKRWLRSLEWRLIFGVQMWLTR